MEEYWTSMDRERYVTAVENYIAELPEPEPQATPEYSLRKIGSSRWIHGQSTDPVRAVMGDIRAGAGHIELTAPGAGRGGQGNPTFEEIDQEQRQVIRDIQKAIDVSVSTHATPSVWGVSGFDPQSNRFSEQKRYNDQAEIQKAIDFAAESTFGGSVVMHTGEFQRPMYNLPGHEGLFESHKGEREDSSYLIVDTDNKVLVSSVQEDKTIWLPVKRRDEDGNIKYVKSEDGDYVDPISHERVPEYEFLENSKDIKFEELSFEQFVDRQIKENPSNIKEYLKKMGLDPSNLDPNNVFVKEAVAKEFYKEQQQAQISHQLMNARVYLENYTEGMRSRSKILEKLNFYKKLKEDLSPEEFAQYKKPQGYRGVDDPPENVDPIKFYQDQLSENDRLLAMGREANISAQRQIHQEQERLKKAKTFREFSLEKSTESFAELGMYAYDKTQSMKQSFKDSKHKDRAKPIYLTLENIYPEQGYGANVDELIDIVKRTRGRLKEKFVEERGMNEQKAKKAAEDHIKATFDTGHFNMWRRFFKHKPGESDEDYDKRFKKWYLEQVEKLAKEGIIGNVHIADNYGYHDAHLAPGLGNTPVRDVMKILKKHGYEDEFAVEGGFNQGRTGFHEAWKHTGASIYSSISGDWTDVGASSFDTVHDHYMGRPQRPYFMFGDYVPDKEGWKPWSGTTME
jgi:hypothetical protein